MAAATAVYVDRRHSGPRRTTAHACRYSGCELSETGLPLEPSPTSVKSREQADDCEYRGARVAKSCQVGNRCGYRCAGQGQPVHDCRSAQHISRLKFDPHGIPFTDVEASCDECLYSPRLLTPGENTGATTAACSAARARLRCVDLDNRPHTVVITDKRDDSTLRVIHGSNCKRAGSGRRRGAQLLALVHRCGDLLNSRFRYFADRGDAVSVDDGAVRIRRANLRPL